MSDGPKPWDLPTINAAESHLRAQNFSPFILNNLINGAFPPCPSEGNYIDSYNPKTGQLFARIHDTSAEEVNKAVEAAERAFATWSTTSPSKRSKYLLRIAELIEERKELFAVWESVDQGKTLARARVEVDRAVSNFRYFYTTVDLITCHQANEDRYFATYILHQSTSARWTDDNVLTYEHRSPTGVFGLISPWNMPLYLLTWKIAPCLAFGCTAVAKPSEVTSLSAYRVFILLAILKVSNVCIVLAKVFQDADLPPGVVNIVFGTGKTTGSSLVKHPKVRGVSFTGGTATGIQIRKDTVEDIGKHVSLELGGKNPTLVFDDVDLSKAVPMAAKAAFENQGEVSVYATFCELGEHPTNEYRSVSAARGSTSNEIFGRNLLINSSHTSNKIISCVKMSEQLLHWNTIKRSAVT